MKILVLAFTVLLASCTDPEPTKLPPQTGGSTRFTVERVGVFTDALAYGDERGIYVIVDTKTGKEYVGVSGVGIAETGSHPAGKSSRVTDER